MALPRKLRSAPAISRREILASGCALAASMLAPPVLAQTRYPSRPVRLVVPFPAGTSPDVIARLWGERFAKSTGQPLVVENKPGAGTIIAAQAVAGAAADGHTLFWTVNNTFSINPFVYRSLPYKLDDFVPVTRILSVPFVLVVSAESKVRSLGDLVREAKARPGAMTYASPGNGTSPHVVMARLLNTAGLSMTHVPYKEAYITDVIAQRIDAAFDASTTVIGQLKGGKVRALGISSATRVEALKDVPPIGETFPGFVGESWHGVFAPRGTPEGIVSTIVEHSQRIVEAPDFRATLAGYGLVPAGGTSAAFRQFLAEDARGWSQVVKDNQITLD
ncbi:Bug family tripartite tricarboxylate transporter substrate binding protein [Caldimonas tepidiphila]|uniref:Bug family tripartite tricarboxylate transporter substrate binding protein n=1 Tax=Caldimonas tepidiphila TaxID=2315841 RepID=UPI000E5ACEB7|nr:tripartite tricarboxylate transporter substrate binding protein [Caldimonas tepidiphila]